MFKDSEPDTRSILMDLMAITFLFCFGDVAEACVLWVTVRYFIALYILTKLKGVYIKLFPFNICSSTTARTSHDNDSCLGECLNNSKRMLPAVIMV
jgi:hypothetical protein